MATRGDIIDILANTFKASITIENIPTLLGNVNYIENNDYAKEDGELSNVLSIGVWAHASFKGVKGISFDRGAIYFAIELWDCFIVGDGEWYDSDYEWNGKNFKLVTDFKTNPTMEKVQKISGGQDIVWRCDIEESDISDDAERIGSLVLNKVFKDMGEEKLAEFVAAAHQRTAGLEQRRQSGF